MCLLILSVQTLYSQSIQVVILDGHDSHAISNEKASVLFKNQRGATEYKTDKNGKFTVFVDPSKSIYVATEWRITCRGSNSENEMYISVEKIFKRRCNAKKYMREATSETIKDKLVIFTKKSLFWQNFKR